MANPNPNIPQTIQDRLNRTPAQRKADLEAKRQARLDAMTPEQRQAARGHIDRVNAVPDDKRPAFVEGSRLAVTAKTIKARVEGRAERTMIASAASTTVERATGAPLTTPSIVKGRPSALQWWDHQRRWLEDHSRLRVCCKARQIGMSTPVATEALHAAVGPIAHPGARFHERAA